tara:strand:- start:7779 stop:8279 length:501 start_codon:yes stop_codon:yes gene_type:complete
MANKFASLIKDLNFDINFNSGLAVVTPQSLMDKIRDSKFGIEYTIHRSECIDGFWTDGVRAGLMTPWSSVGTNTYQNNKFLSIDVTTLPKRAFDILKKTLSNVKKTDDNGIVLTQVDPNNPSKNIPVYESRKTISRVTGEFVFIKHEPSNKIVAAQFKCKEVIPTE